MVSHLVLTIDSGLGILPEFAGHHTFGRAAGLGNRVMLFPPFCIYVAWIRCTYEKLMRLYEKLSLCV